ncbi:hypothetical protein [Methylobacterium oryzisoli]|uniref:hypothetical protein n=1 Tax=Methylobacterium oryzisoli TaxID=3385502 RepID=UPI0038918AEE
MLWHPKSFYPVRNLLFGVVCLVADAGPVIVLVPSLLQATGRDAVIVVAAVAAMLGSAIVAQVNLRTAFNLRGLRGLVEARDRIEVFTVGDYLKRIDLVAAPPVERFGRRLNPDYRILRLPRRAGYSAYQYAPQRSFILVPFRPDEMTLGRLSGLLHEMGHIGLRNWLTATAYANYRIGPEPAQAGPGRDADGGHLRWFRDEGRNIKRRLLRLQAMETAMAFAAIQLFLRDIGPVEGTVLMMFVAVSGYFRVVNARVEAEIEADHYQWFALSRIQSIRGYRPLPGGRATGTGLAAPIRDEFLAEPENWQRNRTLDVIRGDAARGHVGPADAYLWCGVFRTATVWAVLRIVLAVSAAVFVGARAIVVAPPLLLGYAVACGLLIAWSVQARHTSLRRLEEAIAARAETRETSGLQPSAAHP